MDGDSVNNITLKFQLMVELVKNSSGVGCFFHDQGCSVRLENTKLGFSVGVCAWKHLSDFLKAHEFSRLHKDCMLKWVNLEEALKSSVQFRISFKKKNSVGKIFKKDCWQL